MIITVTVGISINHLMYLQMENTYQNHLSITIVISISRYY